MQPLKAISMAVWAAISLSAVTHAFESALHACPAPCNGTPVDWTLYSSVNRLQACHQPMLLDFSLHSPLDSPDSVLKLFACTPETDTANASHSNQGARAAKHHGLSHSKFHHQGASCLSGHDNSASLDLSMTSSSGAVPSSDLHALLDHLQNYFAGVSHCDSTTLFGYFNGAVVGLYSGAAIDNARTSSALVQHLQDQISQDESPQSITMQRCTDTPNADYVFGLAVDTGFDLAAVQESLRSWSNGSCVDAAGSPTQLKDVSIVERSLQEVVSNSTTEMSLSKRGDCRTIKVHGGDLCGSLASRCGISLNDFEKYNDYKKNFCTTLAVGQRVCCSPGGLPDIRPKPNPDGSCHAYKVQSGDTCYALAAANGLEISDISNFNDGKTWGWFGCDHSLPLGLKICLSKGTPPMPAPVSNAVCGPTVPGTEKPTNGTKLAELNQCPLNACCDIWGQCGITPAYCTNATGPTGNPGTAPKDENGCISNCGTNITNSLYPPPKFTKIGYYESWNWDRPCLNLRAGDVSVIDYTHVHWGFAAITDDFNVTINDTYNQWDDFVALNGVRRIISFGGWGYSTSPDTYDMLRKAMDPANVETFVNNIFHFVEANELDGVDFDWEYPGAQDIPGIPPGLESDGPNYLNFLKKMRLNFPVVKSISIAAPASYWYLRAFPISEMAEVLDYIVYMTYDLHGQWDYGNEWTQSGCPGGNCLRSQVNLTETEYRLSMLTKAGVYTDMINVGITSYGRSFGMANEDCTGPNCHFTGTKNHSTAAEGRCTRTAGIIANAEINELLLLDAQDESYYDQGSDSNVIVWNDTWAAYMDDDTKQSRTDYYRGLNFAGTIEWAIDLEQFTGDDGNPSGEFEEPPPPEISKCTATFDSVEDLGNAHDSIPAHCVTQYTVQTLSNLLSASMNNYTDLMDQGYDHKFKIYADAVAGNAGRTVHEFIYKHGNKYFSCEVVETAPCCDLCDSLPSFKEQSCDYCWTDGDCYHHCSLLECVGGSTRRPTLRTMNETEPCPPDYSKRSNKQHAESVYWTLEDDKEAKFYKDIFGSTGVGKDNLAIGNYDRGNNCPPAASIGDGDTCWSLDMDFNIPVASGFEASDVANPKKTVKKALDKSGPIKPQINSALFELSCDAWIGDGRDLIDSISLPILMIAQAVEEMGKVVDYANEIIEAHEREIIAAFLGAILFLIPIAGEVLGSIAELADVGAVLAMAGEAANIAEGVATIVQNPDNAPLAIMNLIFVPGGLTDAAKIAKAAKLRREMKPAHISKLGPKVSSRLDSIKKVTGKCPA